MRYHRRGSAGGRVLAHLVWLPTRRGEPCCQPLRAQAWLLRPFTAFHVVRGSSWEQMTQQPESLGLSGQKSAF